jgi:hypothetical protein
MEGIDLNKVKVEGSDPACLAFPVQASFDAFGLVPGSMTVRTTGTAHWPAVSIDGGPPSQSGTLWVFLKIAGQWYATGAERLRPAQVDGVKPEGSPTDLIGTGWLYAADRWPHMSGYNPAPGELVGLCVVAGSTRSDNQTPYKARTDVILVPWPGAEGRYPCPIVWSETGVIPPAPPGPEPPPPASCWEPYVGDDRFDLVGAILVSDYAEAGRVLDGQSGRWFGRVVWDNVVGDENQHKLSMDDSVAKHRGEWRAALGLPPL